ncbi:MAG: hypothetical protein RQ757_07000 [Pseudomonadales bacterium]|nr:hypothetical protein [Pseudomonadales bacterium]
MTAATKNRNTPTRESTRRGYLAAAAIHVYAGVIVALNAGGFAQPGATATGLRAVGAAVREIDNTDGADGAQIVEVDRGIFRFNNSAGADAIAATDIGKQCYIVDDTTVALTDGTGTRSSAGVIDGVDDDGVWVSIDPSHGALA